MVEGTNNIIAISPYLESRKDTARKKLPSSYRRRYIFDVFESSRGLDSLQALDISHITSFGEKLGIYTVITGIGKFRTIHWGITDVLLNTEEGEIGRVVLYESGTPKRSYDLSKRDTSIQIIFKGSSSNNAGVLITLDNIGNNYKPSNSPA